MDQLIKLTNPEFELEFGGQIYRVRKASLAMGIQYHQKIKQIQENKDPGNDLRVASYAVYLILKPQIPDLTEDKVLDVMPADIDIMDLLTRLGFMNPKITENAKKLQEAIMARQTSSDSLPSSPTGQDGPRPR